MTQTSTVVTDFLTQVKQSQQLWALQEPTSEDWVVLDSINYENAEVMPVWSSAELAQTHCCDEWQGYQPAQISVAEWLEFWVEDLAQDQVMVGVNWHGEEDYVELELAEFSQAIGEIERL